MTIQAREIDEQAAQPCDPPRRVTLSRAKGWSMPPNTVKVDRSTKWGNPFVVGEDGPAGYCVELYARMLGGLLCVTNGASIAEQRVVRDYTLAHIEQLRGKNLACWCRSDRPCHADVLLKIANSTSRRVARS